MVLSVAEDERRRGRGRFPFCVSPAPTEHKELVDARPKAPQASVVCPFKLILKEIQKIL